MEFFYRKYFEWGLPTRRFVQVNIETNTICTRTCHFCLFGIREDVPSTRIPAELYFRIIDELAAMNYAGRLSLFSINEPLTDKRIYDFVRYANLMLPNAYQVLVSNGDLMTRERLDLLLECGLDLLMINSYDQEAHARNRELCDYAESAYPGRIQHSDRTTYDAWVGRAGYVEQYAKPPVAGYCDLPNYALTIKPDGKVLACCHDFDGQNTVGDLTRQSVMEAWYGASFETLRRHLNKGDRGASELCSRCDHQPDLDYFRWNHSLAWRQGKARRLFPAKPDTASLHQAHAIRHKHVERERRRPAREAAPVTFHPPAAGTGTHG
ncbi:MAG: SPASM domain-containing protein [Chromatiales bacterium]|jgi:radical SAM protein with 4Fe4S-binding SPASM domain|nr:SPASM domain-containing protein [Chromatiales bacterium]MDX9768445.1 SPASM domain-containing protein [Ectothiorhodospiraceae bacterium]